MKRSDRILYFIRDIAIAVVAALVIITNQGCAGVNSKSRGDTEFKTPDGFEYRHSSDSKSVTTAPPGASSPSNAWTNPYGAGGEAAGEHQKTPEQILAENSTWFYWIGAAIAVGGAFAWYRGKPVIAIWLGVAGGCFILMPNVLLAINPMLKLLVPVAAIGGAVVAWVSHERGRKNAIEQERIGTVDKAIELKEQGLPIEALAAISTAPTFRERELLRKHQT